MPSYLYFCEVNNEEFETEHSIKVVANECEVCKNKGLENHIPKRLIYGSTLGKMEYTGNELVEKTKEETAKFKKEVYSNPKQYANIIGEEKYHQIQTKMDRRGK